MGEVVFVDNCHDIIYYYRKLVDTTDQYLSIYNMNIGFRH